MPNNTPESGTAPITPVGKANDDFRQNPNTAFKGSVYISIGVSTRGLDFQLAALTAAREDTAFPIDNDPYGDHDRGFMTINGVKVWWKIDCYATGTSFRFGAEDPTDPATTERVLTIFMPEEN